MTPIQRNSGVATRQPSRHVATHVRAIVVANTDVDADAAAFTLSCLDRCAPRAVVELWTYVGSPPSLLHKLNASAKQHRRGTVRVGRSVPPLHSEDAAATLDVFVMMDAITEPQYKCVSVLYKAGAMPLQSPQRVVSGSTEDDTHHTTMHVWEQPKLLSPFDPVWASAGYITGPPKLLGEIATEMCIVPAPSTQHAKNFLIRAFTLTVSAWSQHRGGPHQSVTPHDTIRIAWACTFGWHNVVVEGTLGFIVSSSHNPLASVLIHPVTRQPIMLLGDMTKRTHWNRVCLRPFGTTPITMYLSKQSTLPRVLTDFASAKRTLPRSIQVASHKLRRSNARCLAASIPLISMCLFLACVFVQERKAVTLLKRFQTGETQRNKMIHARPRRSIEMRLKLPRKERLRHRAHDSNVEGVHEQADEEALRQLNGLRTVSSSGDRQRRSKHIPATLKPGRSLRR